MTRLGWLLPGPDRQRHQGPHSGWPLPRVRPVLGDRPQTRSQILRLGLGWGLRPTTLVVEEDTEGMSPVPIYQGGRAPHPTLGGDVPLTRPSGGTYPSPDPRGGTYPAPDPRGGRTPHPTLGGGVPRTRPSGGDKPRARPSGGTYPAPDPRWGRTQRPTFWGGPTWTLLAVSALARKRTFRSEAIAVPIRASECHSPPGPYQRLSESCLD